MSSQPPDGSGSGTAQAESDPVVMIIERAGLTADPDVHECAVFAAAAHLQRYESERADGRALNRSTFLWALAVQDDTVQAALEQNGVRLARFAKLLGISGLPEPDSHPDTFELDETLTRALSAFADARSEPLFAVTTTLLAEAVLDDVVSYGGLLGDRLRELKAEPRAVLEALRGLMTGTGGEGGQSAQDWQQLPRVHDVSPRRFGVQLPPGVDTPTDYVERDVDDELDLLLVNTRPGAVVAMIAPPVAGANRVAFEALLRNRPDDRILLVHELLDEKGSSHVVAEDLDRLLASGADVIWVRNLGTLLDSSPIFEDWFRRRGGSLRATLFVVLRPEDRRRGEMLGLLADAVIELSGQLSPDERGRAREEYGRVLSTVHQMAQATPRVRRVTSRRAPRGSSGQRANYAADSAWAALLVDEQSDSLNIRADVDMIAKLITSRDVDPPLSIGLFGQWGSGKSFFMQQVQLRIQELAVRSRGSSTDAGYLSEVVPVDFNAWQYAQGSALWASLINRVFEGIKKQLGGDSRYQEVLRGIEAKSSVVLEAQQKLAAAREELAKQQPAATDRSIQAVADRHEDITDESIKKLTEGLKLNVKLDQVSDLRHEVETLTTTTSQLRKGWSTASKRRKLLVGGAVAAGLVLVGLVTLLPDALRPVSALIATVGPLLGAAAAILRPVNQGLEQAAKLLRADRMDLDELTQAQVALDDATRELEAAKASGLAGLYGFVSDRSAAVEYRQQLGMTPMIRDDLERLAAMSRKEQGIPGIDRIVIFIDDLDRCGGSEVVRVLEAVNLLFAFPLFVVVVAVDSRWLVKSLEGTFSEAFDDTDDAAPTPQNYLEKIIQIPFWLQPMEPGGFGRLVTTLAGDVQVHRTEDDPESAREASQRGPESWAPVQRRSTSSARGQGDTDGDDPRPSERAAQEPLRRRENAVDAPSRDDLNPEALRLSQDERDFMREFLPLVGTPRAVKRFLNTYQLLRISVVDVKAFLDAGEFRPVLILLALMTGTAPTTDDMIDELREMRDSTFADFLAVRDEDDPWQAVNSACADLPTETLTPAIIDEWLPRVARYSFHPVGA